jgi:response regulator of citrate/malate metabolism
MTTPPEELTVLVVDDDFMVASIHTRFVERAEGFRVVGVAATGESALAEIDRLGPDLVLLDVHLPDVSGIEVLRRLRGAGNDVGVMMVTAAREADTVRAAAAAGAAHYLVKPFEFDDLSARLRAFRQSHQALAGVTSPDQDDIDAVFAPLGRGREALPKGLSPETAAAVLAALRAGRDVSAAECADEVGISRVSARRYLEHFVAQGGATVRLNYGGPGRPERRYRSTG